MRYEIYADKLPNAFGIITAGYSDDKSVTRFGPAERNNYIIHYVLSGQGFFNGRAVKAGQGFLISPKMSEHYFPDSERPWEFVWLIFENTQSIKMLFSEYSSDPESHIFSFTNISDLRQLKAVITKNNSRLYRPSELFEMFLHIFNSHEIAPKNERRAEAVYYNYAVSFINSNLFRKITVEELVKILGISQPYLYNIFMKKASLSPKQYIDRAKTEKAKKLLSETSMQLTQIANFIGIDDCITFSKFFKKRVGVSPSEFRRTKNAD